MDQTLTSMLNGLSGHIPWVDAVMVGISAYGIPAMVLFVALQWWSRTGRPDVRHVAVCAGVAFLLALALNQGLLLFIHRMRPYDAGVTRLLIPPSADWSFPSDHASAATAIVAAFLGQGLPRRTLVLFLMAMAVCLSRVYVGTHYVTDVLGGAATGLLAAVVVRALLTRQGWISQKLTAIL
jgi:undecaprenyl-diphosphatase